MSRCGLGLPYQTTKMQTDGSWKDTATERSKGWCGLGQLGVLPCQVELRRTLEELKVTVFPLTSPRPVRLFFPCPISCIYILTQDLCSSEDNTLSEPHNVGLYRIVNICWRPRPRPMFLRVHSSSFLHLPFGVSALKKESSKLLCNYSKPTI